MPIQMAEDLKVVDLSVGLSSALIVRMLLDTGARVTRVLPEGGDPFSDIYPAYETLKSGAVVSDDLPPLEALLARADICLLGGESHPAIDKGHNPETLSAAFPNLIVLHVGAHVGAEDLPAHDLLVQARTGLVFEQFADRPIQFAVAMPTYGAALTALLGLWAAAVERDTSGKGQVVYATYEQGLSVFWSQVWMQADKADALFDKLPPKGAPHLTFECQDGDYLHLVLGVPGAVSKLYRTLGIEAEVDPNDRGMPVATRGLQNYFADRDLIAPAARKWKRDKLIAALSAAGLAVEPVLKPGEVWDDPQIKAMNLVTTEADGHQRVALPMHFEATPAPVTLTQPLPSPHLSGPLSGLRAMDLGNFIAGPFATKCLADLGCDVIKIEAPESLAALTGIRNTWVSNRGKRSIAVDLKAPEGLALVHRLCATTDITSHNFRVGVAGRLGIDPETLRQHKPDIVCLETTGYGSKGPKASLPGWDMVMQALVGHEYRAGGDGNPPLWYRTALVDFATGISGAIAALIAVHARNRGKGSISVENSLLGSSMFLLSELVRLPNGSFTGSGQLNSDRTGFRATESLYQTKDGWIAIVARTDDMAAALARSLDLKDMPAKGADWGDAEAARLSEAVAQHPTAPLVSQLEQAGVWVEPCATDAWSYLKTRRTPADQPLVIEAEDDTYGRITGAFAPFVHFSRTKVSGPYRSTPPHAAHSRDILTEAGLSTSEIDDLIKRGIVIDKHKTLQGINA